MPTGKSLDDFRIAHDHEAALRKRIDAGLMELADSWEYIGEFLRRIHASTTQWGQQKTFYEKYIVGVPRQDRHGGTKWAIAGTPAFAAKMRAQIKR